MAMEDVRIRLDQLLRYRDDQLQARSYAETKLEGINHQINQIESEMKSLLRSEGVGKVWLPETGATVSIEVRKDVRIIDADEFAAAMIENGMDVPMTEPVAPKIDTRKLKEIGKKLPDWPGAEPFETVVLKIKIDV